MEKHKCKLCLRNFSNGRALGGHMRSHMVNLPVPPKPEHPPPPPLVQLSFEAESAPSLSSPSSSSSEEEDDDKALCYGLRENPKRSFRLVDPDFSFPVESSSVILQDRESETESSKNNPTRTRSKRVCNNNNNHQFHHHHHQKKMKPSNDHPHPHHKNKTELSWVEPEPVSSISDATTEEDVAFWLMMLSRDEWKRREEKYEEEDDDDEEEEDEDEDEDEEDDEEERSVEDSDEFYEEMKSSKTRSSVRGRYKCETCNKVFRSYQALGGHRASHKKIKPVICEPEVDQLQANNNTNNAPPMAAEKKIHECPVCFRVFASGQALGGHKRTHVTGSATTPVRTPLTRFGSDNNSLIDLNLPAPVDEDEISQIENSAVSDAEFLKSSSQIFRAQVA